MVFNLELRAWRKSQGLTQQDLADKLGITRGLVCKWEKGVCYPSPTNIKQLAEIKPFDAEDMYTPVVSYEVARVLNKMRLSTRSNKHNVVFLHKMYNMGLVTPETEVAIYEAIRLGRWKVKIEE